MTYSTEGLAPALSVVMPSLDQCRFLESAVRSVFDQAVPGVELVVADGGSSDGSIGRLAALSARYPGRLRWTSGPDQGPAQALNRAVAMSSGAVIGWLNSDDLYEPGAIRRALDYLATSPGHAMVYGEASHVDAADRVLGRYPTQPPSVPLAEFANGCFICQPSAFVRRAAWLAVGGLDESLRTAFDFDLWLRLFKAYPGGIGFVPVSQARSRLHEATLTARQRDRVALEGLTVLRRHLGRAPPHWLQTRLSELCAEHPFGTTPSDPGAAMRSLLAAASGTLASDDAEMLGEQIAGDRRVQLASPHLFVSVHPDGWAGPVLEVRVRQPAPAWARLVLRCRHVIAGGGALHIDVQAPDAKARSLNVDHEGPFEIEIELGDRRPEARAIYRVNCHDCFVPAESDPGSDDTRELSYVVDGWDAG